MLQTPLIGERCADELVVLGGYGVEALWDEGDGGADSERAGLVEEQVGAPGD